VGAVGASVIVQGVFLCGFGLLNGFVEGSQDGQDSARALNLGVRVEADVGIGGQAGMRVWRHLADELQECVVAGGIEGFACGQLGERPGMTGDAEGLSWCVHEEM